MHWTIYILHVSLDWALIVSLHDTEPVLYWSLLTLTSSTVLGRVRTKAKLLFGQVWGACRCTRWKTCWLLLNCSLMRHWEMFSVLCQFVLIVRQVALHRLWDFMNEWAHYQYEKLLKYLVLTYFYLQGGKHLPLCQVHSDFLKERHGLPTKTSQNLLWSSPKKIQTECVTASQP